MQKETIKNLLRAVKRREPGLLLNMAGLPRWRRQPNRLPWFDLPDADGSISRQFQAGLISPEERDILKKWVTDGYFILDDAVPGDVLEAMNRDIDDLWTSTQPLRGLNILGLQAQGLPSVNLSHSYVVKLSKDEKSRVSTTAGWRIHEFYRFSKSADLLYRDDRLKRFCDLLFGRAAIPFASINFHWGSEQELHQDMAVFHIYPHNYLIGAWIACEDIREDSGPLSYCPGSHREPMFAGFKDYPQTNLRTVERSVADDYQAYIRGLVEKYPVKRFIAKKGQALFWHGQLVHGGSRIHDRSRTRRSFVIHYSVKGANRQQEIAGPYNWQ